MISLIIMRITIEHWPFFLVFGCASGCPSPFCHLPSCYIAAVLGYLEVPYEEKDLLLNCNLVSVICIYLGSQATYKMIRNPKLNVSRETNLEKKKRKKNHSKSSSRIGIQ